MVICWDLDASVPLVYLAPSTGVCEFNFLDTVRLKDGWLARLHLIHLRGDQHCGQSYILFNAEKPETYGTTILGSEGRYDNMIQRLLKRMVSFLSGPHDDHTMELSIGVVRLSGPLVGTTGPQGCRAWNSNAVHACASIYLYLVSPGIKLHSVFVGTAIPVKRTQRNRQVTLTSFPRTQPELSITLHQAGKNLARVPLPKPDSAGACWYALDHLFGTCSSLTMYAELGLLESCRQHHMMHSMKSKLIERVSGGGLNLG